MGAMVRREFLEARGGVLAGRQRVEETVYVSNDASKRRELVSGEQERQKCTSTTGLAVNIPPPSTTCSLRPAALFGCDSVAGSTGQSRLRGLGYAASGGVGVASEPVDQPLFFVASCCPEPAPPVPPVPPQPAFSGISSCTANWPLRAGRWLLYMAMGSLCGCICRVHQKRRIERKTNMAKEARDVPCRPEAERGRQPDVGTSLHQVSVQKRGVRKC